MRNWILSFVLATAGAVGLTASAPASAYDDGRIYVSIGDVSFAYGRPYHRHSRAPLYVVQETWGPRYYYPAPRYYAPAPRYYAPVQYYAPPRAYGYRDDYRYRHDARHDRYDRYDRRDDRHDRRHDRRDDRRDRRWDR